MKKQILLFTILLSSIFLFSTCKRIEETWVKTKVDGTVTDLLTGQPVQGVSVAIYSSLDSKTSFDIIMTTVTDANGLYSLKFHAKHKVNGEKIEYLIGVSQSPGYNHYKVKDNDNLLLKGQHNSKQIYLTS